MRIKAGKFQVIKFRGEIVICQVKPHDADKVQIVFPERIVLIATEELRILGEFENDEECELST